MSCVGTSIGAAGIGAAGVGDALAVDLPLRAAASAAIAGLTGFLSRLAALTVIAGGSAAASAVLGISAGELTAAERLLAAAADDDDVLPELAGAGLIAVTDVSADVMGANACMRNSVIVKPAYSSGARPSSLRPCTTI